MYRILAAICLLSVIYSCKNNKKPLGPTQGLVRYKIDYPDEIKSKPMVALLPVEMDLLFDSSALKLKVKGDMNLFSLEFLSRDNGDSCFTVFRMPTKKMVYQLEKGETWFLFDSGASPTVELRPDSVKSIAGFECKMVELRYKSEPNMVVNAFFTDQLEIKPTMFRTPFGNVPGVPMEFEIVYNSMCFKFKAQRFLPLPADEKMELPANYELTSRQEIRSLIDYLLN